MFVLYKKMEPIKKYMRDSEFYDLFPILLIFMFIETFISRSIDDKIKNNIKKTICLDSAKYVLNVNFSSLLYIF